MTTKQSAQTTEPWRFPAVDLESFAGLSAWQNDALDVVTRAGQAYSSGVAAIGEEVATFVQTRLQHNLALGEALARCHTLTDVTNVQRDWMKEAAQEYADETRKLMELGSNLMRESWNPLERTATGLAGAAKKAPEKE